MGLVFLRFYIWPIPFDDASAMTVHYLFTPSLL